MCLRTPSAAAAANVNSDPADRSDHEYLNKAIMMVPEIGHTISLPAAAAVDVVVTEPLDWIDL